MSDEEDIGYGILVHPPRHESEGSHAEQLSNGNSNGSKTTPAHIQDDDNDINLMKELEEKEERIRSLEQKYASMETKYQSELKTAQEELTEAHSTVQLLKSMLDEQKDAGLNSSIRSASSDVSAPPPESAFDIVQSSDHLEAVNRQNEDYKVKIQHLIREMEELRIQLKIAQNEARGSEERLQKFISERDDAMAGVDQERIWMSTQLSNCEQQIAELQNENISLLMSLREEKEKQKQSFGGGGYAPSGEPEIPVATFVLEDPGVDEYEDALSSRSRFGFKRKFKDEQLALAFHTAQAYFAHKQHKHKDRHEMGESLDRQSSSSSFCQVPSSKGQADLLAKHMLETKPNSMVGYVWEKSRKTNSIVKTSNKSSNALPLTLVDEMKLEKAEQRREQALYDMLKN